MKKTGLRGMAGNKGAVAIRLDYHDASMCSKPHRKEDFSRLLEADQLSNQVAFGLAFNDYIEGPITFLPTYKYDDGTMNMILARRHEFLHGLIEFYHRPVMSSFDIEVIKYDEVAKERLQRELYQIHVKKLEDKKVEPAVGVLIDFEDKDNSKEEDLPPPSSETYQWWNSASSSSTSSLVVDKNDIDKEFRNISSNPFHEDLIRKPVPPPPPKPNSLSSNILTPRKINDSDSKNNISKDTQVPKFEDISSKSNLDTSSMSFNY
ncbi:unnamed protein product [Rhizophagus irregularis]|nr:unnamed protein product [Rhizophagus irregularis]